MMQMPVLTGGEADLIDAWLHSGVRNVIGMGPLKLKEYFEPNSKEKA